jgi:cobalt/nickel transport system permease protein
VSLLDPYRAGDSLIHRLDPRVKFVLAVAFIVTASMLPFGAWPVYLLMLGLAVSLVVLSELGLGYVLKRASLALPFTLAAVPLIFTISGTPLFQLNLGAVQLTASLQGLERFASICFKSYVSVMVAIVLAASTPFTDLLLAMRALHVPKLLVAIFGLMWRYLFVLADEAQRLLRARASRSGASSQPGMTKTRTGGTLAWRARVAGGMTGSLFLRSVERGDRIYAAMAARGYDGELRAFALPPLPSPQVIVLIMGLAVLLSLLLLSRLFG